MQDDMTGSELIAAERQRQIEVEGWTPDHDAEHTEGQLVQAAIAYAAQEPTWWPFYWPKEFFKLTPNDRVRDLVKAGALIAAEIDRLKQGG